MTQSERDQFISHFPVSHETLQKLERYAGCLAEWTQKFNLVSASTLPHVWSRHFLDCAQLVKSIPVKATTVADMGSGAGFPGLVLSIMGIKTVHLIEATGKKANFLRAVIDELKLDAVVHQDRVENIKDLKADVITARALSPLPELFKLAQRLAREDTLCLFLKGQNAEAELTESAKYWTYECDRVQSISDSSGSVLIIRDLQYKHALSLKKQIQRRRARDA